MDFPLADSGYEYRPLRVRPEPLVGWDVFALQTGLVALGYGVGPTGTDGIFGRRTKRAVKQLQTDLDLVTDGIAGIETQRQIAWNLAIGAELAHNLPKGLPYGHLEHESSCILGNYTAPYPDDSRDCGVAQRNTRYTPAEHGFHAPESVRALSKQLVDYHAKYRSWGVSDPRAWELACGSWNAPASTDALARGQSLSDWERDRIERYISAVTAYTDF